MIRSLILGVLAMVLLVSGPTPAYSCGAKVEIRFSDFQPGREFMFVIDVEDRLENSEFGQAEVSNAEIEGAAAKAVLMGKSGQSSTAKGLFDGDARALLKGWVCA